MGSAEKGESGDGGGRAAMMEAGAAKIDITPEGPIHLSGYAVRPEECVGIEMRLWAEALAMGSDGEGVSLLLTVDNTGVPAHVTEALFARLAGKAGLVRENFAICSTHTHHAPMLTGVLPNLFSRDIEPGPQLRIDGYTALLIDRLEEVALAAVADRSAARLSWGFGTVTFAKNRRTEGGPVDHKLPVLCVRSPEGKLRAVFIRYACHCTTVDRRFNKTHGDWAGEARVAIEKAHPGVVVLIAIGCGADAGPRPYGTFELARRYGREVADEVSRLVAVELRPISSKPAGRVARFDLPFEELPTWDQWEARAAGEGIVAYHARKNLARIDRGETLPGTLPYSVQSWIFGTDLAMLFLPGEVVVDYALRIADEFDPDRTWLNAYANDVPCYIPSRRILREGGYEAEGSLWYYDRPARLAPETEDIILEAIHQQVGEFAGGRRGKDIRDEP